MVADRRTFHSINLRVNSFSAEISFSSFHLIYLELNESDGLSAFC